VSFVQFVKLGVHVWCLGFRHLGTYQKNPVGFLGTPT